MDNTNNIITTNITEKELHPVTGMLMLIINIVGILFSMLLCVISPLLFYGAAGGLELSSVCCFLFYFVSCSPDLRWSIRMKRWY